MVEKGGHANKEKQPEAVMIEQISIVTEAGKTASKRRLKKDTHFY
jgi:hypothetical protein